MALGILFSCLAGKCIDYKYPCRSTTDEPARKIKNSLVLSTGIFDVLAMIALITVGSLSLQGRIGCLSRTAGIGFLGGAGGVLLIGISCVIFEPFLQSRAAAVKTRSTVR